MQMPMVPMTELAREGKLTPIISLILVGMCIAGLLLGAFSPTLAAEAEKFSTLAGILGGASHLTSIAHNIVAAWQNRVRVSTDASLVLANKPTLAQAEKEG